MLAYARCKSVGVQKQGKDRRVANGILEDELYAMECKIVVNRPTLIIESVQTHMKRFTTNRCTRAEKVFAKAEGWKLDRDLDGKIKNELGRHGCRHMAILLVDCCRALARAEVARDLRDALAKDPGQDAKQFIYEFYGCNPELTDYLRLQ